MLRNRASAEAADVLAVGSSLVATPEVWETECKSTILNLHKWISDGYVVDKWISDG